jgi:hypothetical protein
MGWVVSVTPRPRFDPRGKDPGTNCTGGWVGLRAGLDTETRGKILCPCRGSNSDRPVVQPVVRHYTTWATRLLAHPVGKVNTDSAPYAAVTPSYCRLLGDGACLLCGAENSGWSPQDEICIVEDLTTSSNACPRLSVCLAAITKSPQRARIKMRV